MSAQERTRGLRCRGGCSLPHFAPTSLTLFLYTSFFVITEFMHPSFPVHGLTSLFPSIRLQPPLTYALVLAECLLLFVFRFSSLHCVVFKKHGSWTVSHLIEKCCFTKIRTIFLILVCLLPLYSLNSHSKWQH